MKIIKNFFDIFKKKNKDKVDQILIETKKQTAQNLIYRRILNSIGDYPKASGILREFQEVNLYILLRLKSICEKLGLTFWLHGGTLLGAARHKGFIPWDDDVDIGMMRKDFNVLNEYLKKNEEIEIQRFYYMGICSRQPRVVFKGGYLPFFIDIMIYDDVNTSDVTATWNAQCQKKDEAVRRLKKTGILENKKRRLIENKKERQIVDKIYDEYRLPYIENGNAIIFNIDEGTIVVKARTEKNDVFVRCFKKEFIFPFTQLEFEGVKFNAPLNYDEYLILQYGDYMLLPQRLEYSQHLGTCSKDALLQIHKIFKLIKEGDQEKIFARFLKSE